MSSLWKLHLYCSIFLSFLDLPEAQCQRPWLLVDKTAMEKSQYALFSTNNTRGEWNLQLLILRNLNPSPFGVYKLSHPPRGSHLSEEGNLLSCPLAPNHIRPTRPTHPHGNYGFPQKCRCFHIVFGGACLIFGKLNEKLLKGRLWDGILRNTCQHCLCFR